MRIVFHLNYRTNNNETPAINFVSNDNVIYNKVLMCSNNSQDWDCEVVIECKQNEEKQYFYSIEEQGNTKRVEWSGGKHSLRKTFSNTKNVDVYDIWKDIPQSAPLYSSAFVNCINKKTNHTIQQTNYNRTLQLKVFAPYLRENDNLLISGNEFFLGSWNIDKAIELLHINNNEYSININLPQTCEYIEFKFVLKSKEDSKKIIWEDIPNRTLSLKDKADSDVICVDLNETLLKNETIKCVGTMIPLFSLRSKNSFGVGDFSDLNLLIEWISLTKQSIIQLLPINDTTATHTNKDSYPYRCVSVFALHPQYVALSWLPEIKDEKKKARFLKIKKELNDLKYVDYDRVNNEKINYLKLLFNDIGKNIMQESAFKQFLKTEGWWLAPYALYCKNRDFYNTECFDDWQENSSWDEDMLDILLNINTTEFQEVSFYYFVQYILHNQLTKVKQYAEEKGVILKGDIPIGVSRWGCDAWQNPELFHLNQQAGAPPDFFSSYGQNWEFPTYNWQKMLENDCVWHKKRFNKLSDYFHAYRIDHILGFFRIWEIPENCVYAQLGHFSPAYGFSLDEIKNNGLYLDKNRLTQPFITENIIAEIFENHAEYIKKTFLTKLNNGLYVFKTEFNSQRKVERFFDNNEYRDEFIKNKLYEMQADVLFVADHYYENVLHPRISSHSCNSYKYLNEQEKQAYNNIYNSYFYNRNEQLWQDEALKKLPKIIEATKMLVCGEDLGMLPFCVSNVMNWLKILSLEIESMPKFGNSYFSDLNSVPYNSVTMPTTHDMATLREFWDTDINRSQYYYNNVLHCKGEAKRPLSGSIAKQIIKRNVNSSSIITIIALQDWFALDEKLRAKNYLNERVNNPGNPNNFWCYRIHINLEDLIKANDFNNNIIQIISSCKDN